MRTRELMPFLPATALAASLLTASLLAGPAAAATFDVNTLLDGRDVFPGDGVCATVLGTCSVRAALQEAEALPGPDVVRLGPGVHELTEEDPVRPWLGIRFILTGDVTLVGAGSDHTAIHQSLTSPLLDLRDGARLHATGLTLSGGTGFSSWADDGSNLLLGAGSSAVLDDCALVDGSNATDGGAARVIDAELTLRRTRVARNRSLNFGAGGILLDGGRLVIEDSVIEESTQGALAPGGGALLVRDGEFAVRRSTLRANDSGAGSALLLLAGTALLEDSAITDNSGYTAGIVLASGSAAELTLRNCRVEGNRGSAGVALRQARGAIEDSLIAAQQANRGLAVTEGATVDVRRTTFRSNRIGHPPRLRGSRGRCLGRKRRRPLRGL